MRKITITGTKGKTTTTAVISHVLRTLGHNVLKVDTNGHYVNGVQKSTLEESRNIWGLVPTVCPGRYLWEFQTNPSLQENAVAVLESSLGSSALAGLGYRHHDVGVFLNVMEDHLGSSQRLKTRADIAKAKSFIFSRIAQNGYVVFNADDELVIKTLDKVPAERAATRIPCGLHFERFPLAQHLKNGGIALTIRDNNLLLLSQDKETILCNVAAVAWTFNATFKPSLYNLLHVTGAIYGHYNGVLPAGFRKAIEASQLDPDSGRLHLMTAKNGTRVLVDYAHEKNSLAAVGRLAKSLAPEGSVIGVVRLAYDRTPELIQDTGRYIAPYFDSFVVYDKIDGYWGKAELLPGRRFNKVEGKVSQLFADAIAEKNSRVQRIVREDEAIQAAANMATPHDIVVVIANEHIERSLGFVRQAFHLEHS